LEDQHSKEVGSTSSPAGPGLILGVSKNFHNFLMRLYRQKKYCLEHVVS